MAGVWRPRGLKYFFLKSTIELGVDHSRDRGNRNRIVPAVHGALRGRERLTANRDQFRVLLDGCKDCAVVSVGCRGRVATWNTGAHTNAKGIQRGEMLGRSTEMFYGAEGNTSRKANEQLLAQAAERGVTYRRMANAERRGAILGGGNHHGAVWMKRSLTGYAKPPEM